MNEIVLIAPTAQTLSRPWVTALSNTTERVLVFVASLQDEPFRGRMASVLEPLTTELLSIVEHLGVEPPIRAATVVQGAIAAAFDHVRAGGDPDEVAADTIAFVRAGLSALSNTSTAPPARHADDVALGSGDAEGEQHRRAAPGALAMVATPSISVALAAAVSPADAPSAVQPLSVQRPSAQRLSAQPARVRVARIAVAQLGWAAVAFATGMAGVGGSALHAALGLSLAAILAWSVRSLAPVGLAPSGLRSIAVLAAVTSAVALVARHQRIDTALITHIVLAVALLLGLTSVARVA